MRPRTLLATCVTRQQIVQQTEKLDAHAALDIQRQATSSVYWCDQAQNRGVMVAAMPMPMPCNIEVRTLTGLRIQKEEQHWALYANDSDAPLALIVLQTTPPSCACAEPAGSRRANKRCDKRCQALLGR
jgi:S-formylglutathione hydrolase FrmB